MIKFACVKEDHDRSSDLNPERSFDYGNTYEIEKTISYQRIKIGPSSDQIDLILKLSETMKPPFFILYVLVIKRLNNNPGRYQSSLIEDREELISFLHQYREFFESDGRHHIWLSSIDDSGMLIYDQHNVIYAYGNSKKYTAILKEQGFKEQITSFPAPHVHFYHPDNDKFEEELLRSEDWTYFPLAENDLYD